MNLFTVTAPISIRYPSGELKLVIEKFEHPQGIVIFEPFWHLRDIRESVHLIQGKLSGDGPWKINDHVMTVTGCQGTDPEMAASLSEWQAYLMSPDAEYPSDEEIKYLAKRLGCII